MSLDDTVPGDWRPTALLVIGAAVGTLIWERDSRYDDWKHVDSVLVGVLVAFAHSVGRLR